MVVLSALLLCTLSRAAVAEPAPASAATVRPASAEELVIANGTFVSADGRSTPATLRNVVDAITQRHPHANITMVGVDDVIIRNVRLRWGKRVGVEDTDPQDVPLAGMLTALCEASGRQFEVRPFGRNDFVLSTGDAPKTAQRVEIFNLGSLTRQDRNRAAMEEDVRRYEMEYTVLGKTYGEKHPRMLEIADRIAVWKAQLAQKTPAGQEVVKVIEQIQDVVGTTLRLKSRDALPEFKYHAGSNLLIVIGSDEAMDVTRKVIAALEKAP
jgi:hypothetical protein